MPTTISAKKNVRQNIRRRARNHWRKRRIKTQVKTFLKAIQAQDVDADAAETEFRKACGLLDKFATTSTIHRNTAARRQRRLAKGLNHLKKVTR